MEEMRQQLHEYRIRGAAASREMQLTARRVERENARLRILLARRGVSVDEIQAFLQLPEDELSHVETQQMPRQTGENEIGSKANLQPAYTSCLAPNYDTGACLEIDKLKDYKSPKAPMHDMTHSETSCQVAADLIADFHGHEDVAHVLMMLGCSETDDCRVKNTQVFQIMDGAA